MVSPDPIITYEDIPMRPMTDDIWSLILDRQHIPETLIHMLKGEVWIVEEEPDEKGQLVKAGRWEARGRPLMNEKGIRFFTVFIYSAVTPDKLTTRLDEDEVKRLVREMMMSITEVIWERGDEFNIAASDRSFLLRLLEQNYLLSLSASRKGTILDVLKPTMRREEKVLPQKENKDNLFSNMLGGRRQ